jgi:hypothetical protein
MCAYTRPLDSAFQSSPYRQGDPQAGLRLEGAVGEVPVVADGNAESGHPVEDERDDHVVPAESPAPQQRYGRDQGHERDGHEDADQDTLERRGRFLLEVRPDLT